VEPDANANDPISPLLRRETDSAKIETDERYGYDRIYPAKDILAKMGSTYADQVEQGDKNYEERFRRMRAAEDAYEADEPGANEVLTVPLGKGIINQQIAWVSNQILGKDPYMTFRPLDGGSYEVPVGVMDSPSTNTPVVGYEEAGPQPIYETEELSSEEIAANFQDLIQYYLTECEDFEQLVEDTTHAIMVGENPTYWRIDYDPRVLHAKTRKFIRTAKGDVQIFGVEDTTVVPRNLVRIRHVSGYNVTTSLPIEDEQTAWWIAEKNPLTNQKLWEGIKEGRYDFARKWGKKGPDQSLIDKVMNFGENLRENDPIEARADRIDSLVAEKPLAEHDVRTLSFFHPFLITQQDGTKAIEIRSCLGDLHVKSRTFLSMTANWSWSGQRLIVPFFRHKRPHRFSGMSASGDVAPIQALLSSFMDLQVKNKVQNTLKVFLIKENSPTWRQLKAKNFQVRPGDALSFDEPSDISLQQLGAPVETLAPEIGMLTAMGESLLRQDETDIPNRTPGATVALTQQSVKQQSIQLLRSERRSIAKAIMLYLQTIAQFSQYAVIPYNDPEKKKIVSKIIGFPREVIANHFSCRVTATGDDDSAQARFEKAGLLAQDTDAQNEADMGLLQTILDGQVPQAKRDAAQFLLLRRNRLYAERIRSFKLDTQHYAIDEKMIAGWRQSLIDEAAQQAEAAAAAAAQGGVNAPQLPTAEGGGSVPQLQAGQESSGSSGGQPVLPGVPVATPPEAVRPPGALGP